MRVLVLRVIQTRTCQLGCVSRGSWRHYEGNIAAYRKLPISINRTASVAFPLEERTLPSAAVFVTLAERCISGLYPSG